MNSTLSNLSQSLMSLHKSLLDYQTAATQIEDNKNYGPFEILNLSLNDPRFQWFRKLSQMIIQADIRSSNKIEPGTLEAPEIYHQLTELFNDNEFIKRYETALMSDPTLVLKLGTVKKHLSQLKIFFN